MDGLLEVAVTKMHALQVHTQTGLSGLLNADAGILEGLPVRDPEATDTCRELGVMSRVIQKNEGVKGLPSGDVLLLKGLTYLHFMGCFRRLEAAEGEDGRWDVSYLASTARAAADLMFRVRGQKRMLGAAPLAAGAACQAPDSVAFGGRSWGLSELGQSTADP